MNAVLKNLPLLKYRASIFMDELRENSKNLRKKSRSPGRDLNRNSRTRSRSGNH